MEGVMSAAASVPSVDTSSEHSRPKQLFGFDVIHRIGAGAGSTIYAVSDPLTGRRFALKHVVCKTRKHLRLIEQLRTEMEVGSLVRHPGLRRSLEMRYRRTLLRRILEAGLVLDLVDGVPLERRPPEGVSEVVAVFIQVAQALGALHAAGWVHCDLKPNNILKDDGGLVKVIDLGQTARYGTIKVRIQGTPDYMAPEQLTRKPVTVQTDVFNFGATMYWALCGRPLPTLYNIGKAENSFLFDRMISSPQEVNPAIPEPLSHLVMECVRTRPAKRPQDMVELIRHLEIIEYVLKKKAPGAAPAAEPQPKSL
jgi:serine/threonine-protein kinase